MKHIKCGEPITCLFLEDPESGFVPDTQGIFTIKIATYSMEIQK